MFGRRKPLPALNLRRKRTRLPSYVSFNNGRIAGEYTDREVKQLGLRPELAKAIEHAIRLEATLVIAHMGRLVSNVPVTRLLVGKPSGLRLPGQPRHPPAVDQPCCEHGRRGNPQTQRPGQDQPGGGEGPGREARFRTILGSRRRTICGEPTRPSPPPRRRNARASATPTPS